MPHSRPYLDTVVVLDAFDGDGRKRWTGTGFFCRARHWHQQGRELLFPVTNAHVVDKELDRIVVLFSPRAGDRVVAHSVTARIGREPGAWRVDHRYDLAALLVRPERLPTDAIRYRSFELETDTLAIPELGRQQIAEGDEVLFVGFALPHREGPRQYPATRLATISGIPKRARLERPLKLEGTAFPGNSGSPLIVKPGRDADRDCGSDPGGKLIGIHCRAAHFATTVRSNEHGLPIEVREQAGIIHAAPVDALRDLIATSVAAVILAETFGPLVRRVRGWLRRREPAE